MIDRTLVRYFLAVVDAGNFSRAASAVAVSQPTLSIGIARLERLLDTRLFHRTNQRVALTDAGSLFLPHARRIESGFREAQAAVAPDRVARHVRLGVLATLPTSWLTALLAAHRQTGGIDRIELVEGSPRDLRGALDRGRIDLALTLRPAVAGRFGHETIWSEGYAMMLPARHPLARETSIDGAALAGETMMVRRHCEVLADTSRYFVDRGVRPPFALRTRSDDRALATVAAGAAITLMPAGFRHSGVVGVPLEGFELVRDIGLQATDEARSLIEGSFGALVRETIRVAARGE